MSIFHLRSLKTLELSSNNFSGPINLSSFQLLKNLSTLDLSFNSLSINEADTDPVSFPQIRTLKLISCNLTRFPNFLKEQSKLNVLDLSENQIDGEIPNWVWNITSLAYLNLSHNFLVNLQEPPTILTSNLSALDLSGNKLQGQIPNPPPVATYLDYSSNSFSYVIPANIGDFLSVLDLSNNFLHGTIPQCLIGMEYLRVLNLRGNNLSGNISDTFSTNCGIRTLDLSRNHLEGKIPGSLANCTRLEVLDLGNNFINDVFPCHLKNKSSLRVLVLRSNHFQGPISCPNDNSSWPMLQIVDLASNNFSGKLPEQHLRTWKPMMNDEDELQHLRFEFLPLNSLYYQDSITVTIKGLELQLTKILTLFTSIDV
ncbi:hypothetical protein SLEP1_g31948 [Rubroshorea leprosula]|uniref:Uncharacterized protein n=1 Tax=Rubroshorea leprosula TaxID=152421 RepID=A0AAV5KBS4_9ROSI|nr:hypothetical protein SLEP1_g31948 [Rubroshorea leprosula]